MVDGFAKTPRYVLREGPLPTSPILIRTSSDDETKIIFGFSDKPEYDTFLSASSKALTPYPLVKGYLQNQVALEVDALKLVVLDAASPQQQLLHAATFQDVEEAFQRDSPSVPITYQLTLDQGSRSYRVQPIAKTMPASSTV